MQQPDDPVGHPERQQVQPPKLTVVIPVGPNHRDSYQDAVRSVEQARGFDGTIEVVEDFDGALGRCRARNIGARRSNSEWLCFLDADDLMDPEALDILDKHGPYYDAIWGPPSLESESGGMHRPYPVWRPVKTLPDYLTVGPQCGLLTTSFIRRTAFEAVGGWYEPWDFCEDHELAMALLFNVRWTTVDQRIVIVRRWKPRAGGPRGYEIKGPTDPVIQIAVRRMQSLFEWWKLNRKMPDIAAVRSSGEAWHRITG